MKRLIVILCSTVFFSIPVSAQCSDVLGDPNNDGIINIADVSTVVSYISGATDCMPCFANADIDGNGEVNGCDKNLLIELALGSPACVNGDVNGNGKVDTGDAASILTYLSGGTLSLASCIDLGDADGDGDVDSDDATYIMSYLFTGGPAPVIGPC